MTVQTAFRFEESMIKQMKQRAKLKHQSVNAYVSELIANDLRENSPLPRVTLPEALDEDIRRLAGSVRMPSAAELEDDERLRRIWER